MAAVLLLKIISAKMVDPTQITNYLASEKELEELILFWVCASGKNGVTAAKCLDSLLNSWIAESPFEAIKKIIDFSCLEEELKRHGIGCYRNKAKTFKELVYKNLNLKTCSVEDLESIYGIGPKTARCFVIHSRPNQMYAGLDRHILSYLRDQGYPVPKSTPIGKKYRQIEKIFLDLVKKSGKTVSEMDLMIWNQYRDKS